MDKETVYSFDKNALEQVRASIYEYQGKTYADLRVFWYDNTAGQYKPTKKGLTVNVVLLPELARAVDDLQTAAKQ